jgi:hypothetical protein
MSDGGKGSKARPFSVSQEEYDNRWDAIFNRDVKEEPMLDMDVVFRENACYELKNGICTVVFEKKDGSERVMNCTLLNEHIPIEQLPKGLKVNDNSNSISVWDVDVEGWRSFRWDSVKSFAVNVKTV